MNPNESVDVEAVHALQDKIKAELKTVGKFEAPAWDPVSLKKIRDALLALAAANGGLDSSRMFGRKGSGRSGSAPDRHRRGLGWQPAGRPRSTSGVEPKDNDGKRAYRLTLKDVPVDGFWSLSVYNKHGFFEKNAKDAYTLNNVTARPNADGSATIHFGG